MTAWCDPPSGPTVDSTAQRGSARYPRTESRSLATSGKRSPRTRARSESTRRTWHEDKSSYHQTDHSECAYDVHTAELREVA